MKIKVGLVKSMVLYDEPMEEFRQDSALQRGMFY